MGIRNPPDPRRRRARPDDRARAVPIYQTTSYTFRDTAHAAALFGLEELGNIYTRIMNPTQAVFEERVASLEGGVAALAVASGQAAETISPVEPGRERRPHRLLGLALRRHLQPVPLHAAQARDRGHLRRRPRRPRRVACAIRPNTKAFYAETLGNPKGDVLDFEGVSAVAHEHGIPLVVDNTLATPYLAQPARATAPTSSCTRPPSSSAGTARPSAAIIVDGGTFDYEGSGRFPGSPSPTRATTASSSASSPRRCSRPATS